MKNQINLQKLDDEELTVLETYLNDKNTKTHIEFFNSFALDSIYNKSLASQIEESMQCIAMSILYDVFISNIEFTKHWIKDLNMKPNFKFFIERAISDEKRKRIHQVYLTKFPEKKIDLIDKIKKI